MSKEDDFVIRKIASPPRYVSGKSSFFPHSVVYSDTQLEPGVWYKISEHEPPKGSIGLKVLLEERIADTKSGPLYGYTVWVFRHDSWGCEDEFYAGHSPEFEASERFMIIPE